MGKNNTKRAVRVHQNTKTVKQAEQNSQLKDAAMLCTPDKHMNQSPFKHSINLIICKVAQSVD